MGLSSFNAMRARMRAEAAALEKSSANVEAPAPADVEASEPAGEKPAKRTDAEKLKNKKG